MAVQREQKVSAANYNTLQNRVARILGTGVEQNGYGQELACNARARCRAPRSGLKGSRVRVGARLWVRVRSEGEG